MSPVGRGPQCPSQELRKCKRNRRPRSNGARGSDVYSRPGRFLAGRNKICHVTSRPFNSQLNCRAETGHFHTCTAAATTEVDSLDQSAIQNRKVRQNYERKYCYSVRNFALVQTACKCSNH